jgi:hypothetical protein
MFGKFFVANHTIKATLGRKSSDKRVLSHSKQTKIKKLKKKLFLYTIYIYTYSYLLLFIISILVEI